MPPSTIVPHHHETQNVDAIADTQAHDMECLTTKTEVFNITTPETR